MFIKTFLSMLAVSSYKETYPCGGSVQIRDVSVNPHISSHGAHVSVIIGFFLGSPVPNATQVCATYANRREMILDRQELGDLPVGENTLVVRGPFPRLVGSIETQIRVVDKNEKLLICVSNRYIEEIAF